LQGGISNPLQWNEKNLLEKNKKIALKQQKRKEERKKRRRKKKKRNLP